MSLKSIVAALLAMFFAGTLAAAPTPTPAPAVTPNPAFVPPPPLTPENTWLLDLSTGGRVTIQLRPDVAPNHVERIKLLTRRGFYNGLTFHRVIEGFMAQGGDPKGDGTGGSELPDLKAEFNWLPHARGAVSAARASSDDSANSQFFIIFAPRLSLDHKYTVFGRVVEGMQYVDAIERGEPPANPTRILRASIGADHIAPPAPGEVIVRPPQPAVPPPVATPPAPAPATTAPATGGAAPAPAATAPANGPSGLNGPEAAPQR